MKYEVNLKLAKINFKEKKNTLKPDKVLQLKC